MRPVRSATASLAVHSVRDATPAFVFAVPSGSPGSTPPGEPASGPGGGKRGRSPMGFALLVFGLPLLLILLVEILRS